MTRLWLWIGLASACALPFSALPAAAQQDGEETGEAKLDLRRSPEAQARTAIRAGDFRVARLVHSHEDEVGHLSFGQGTPGLACDGNLSEAAARDLPWSGKAAVRFASAYNRVLLAAPRYPDRDVCLLLDEGDRGSPWPDFSKPQGRPLHPKTGVNRAARAARSDLVRAQIAAGRPFDSWDRWYRRPLHWAARRGDLATLDLLLAAGARPDGKEPASPVLLAADSGNGAAVERLLAAGASPSKCGRIDVRLSWGSTTGGARHSCPLRHSIERGLAGPVGPLVKGILARATYNDRDDLAGEFYKAVESGRTDIVRAFANALGPARDRFLQPSAMRIAAYRADLAMLRTLLSFGGGWAARTPAEERLWFAAAKQSRPEPLALLAWFGSDLNYLSAAERLSLEAALPSLTAARLRPFLVQAYEAREKTWDAVLAGDLAALDALADLGVDFAERRGGTAISRAAGRDSATLRWMLAQGGRADTYEEREPHIGCATVESDSDEKKFTRAQRETFAALCGEQESRWPKKRPEGEFSDHALVTAVRAGDPATVGLLLSASRPEAGLEALHYLALRAPARPDRLPLLTSLAALAAKGDRAELAGTLSNVLERKDSAAAAAILAGYRPTGEREVRFASDIGYSEDRCRLDHLRVLRDHGVDLSDWRFGGNLFARAAECGSAEFVAFAATVPGIGVNDLDEYGRTPFEYLALDEGKSEARKAMIALGAKSCVDLFGDESDKCGSSGIAPDPAL